MQPLQLSCDEPGFISNIPFLFAHTSAFVTELAQNSRRAKAKQLEISINKAKRTITFIDDGCGISDFNILFRANKSAHEGCYDENPFGLGFLSVFAVSEEVLIRSQAGTIMFNTKSLLAGGCAEQLSTVGHDGTLIELTIKQGKEYALFFENGVYNQLLKGFDLPVYFDGQRVTQNLVINNEDFIEGEFGFYQKASLHNYKRRNYHQNNSGIGSVFCQGLPLDEDSMATVAHLKPGLFTPVLPARNRLVDHDESIEKIRKDIKQTAIKFISSELSSAIDSGDNSAEQAVLEEFKMFILNHCIYLKDVLLKSNYLYADSISQFTGDAVEYIPNCYGSYTGLKSESDFNAFIKKTDFYNQMKFVVSCIDLDDDQLIYSAVPSLATALHAEGKVVYLVVATPFLNMHLESAGFVQPKIQVQTEGGDGNQYFGGNMVSFDIQIVDSITLQVGEDKVATNLVTDDDILYITKPALAEVSFSPLRLNAYEVNDCFSEFDFEEDKRELQLKLKTLSLSTQGDEGGASVLNLYLAKLGALPELLRGQEFAIAIDATGQVQVR